ncbi:MAG TPA: patatin-like phospholipase family protein [Streptosporangiaceae bacterium]
MDVERALVLGGGGVAGIGWEAGILAGAAEAGIDLGRADVVIGTSAGSVVGAYVAHGLGTSGAVDRMEASPDRAAMAVDMNRVMEAMALTFDASLEPRDARTRVGKLALEFTPPDTPDPAGGVRALLPRTDWPARRLLVTAVDTADGAFTVWDSESGVALSDAIASSCAVPCAFPPVSINGHRYMDGGVRSATNADLAKGAATVVIIEPLANLRPPEPLQRELAALDGARVLVVGPDAASEKAFGAGVLDPAVGRPSFAAGLAQGAAAAAEIARVWG